MTSALLHSLLFAVLTATLAAALGLTAFLALASSSRRVQITLISASVATVLMPPFLQADAWCAIATRLDFSIASLPFGAAVLSLQLWPLATLLLFAMSQRLDASLMESARLALSSRDTWMRVILPLLSPALALAWVAAFVLALNNFLIPTTFQTHTQLTNIYVDFMSRLDTRSALLQSIPLWILSLIALAAAAGLATRFNAPATNRHTDSVNAFPLQGVPTPGHRIWIFVATALLLLSAAPPLVRIARSCFNERLVSAFLLARPQLGTSLAYAIGGAILASTLALVTWRLFPRGRIEWLLATPFILSGFFLCIAIIAVSQWAGAWAVWQGTWAVCILAYGIRFVWIPYKAILSARQHIRPDLIEAAALFRLPRSSVFRHVEWPAIRPALFAAAWLVYVLALWDVETLVMIYPPGGEPMSLRIYQLLHDGAETSVGALSLAMLVMGLAPGLALLFFRDKRNLPLPTGS